LALFYSSKTGVFALLLRLEVFNKPLPVLLIFIDLLLSPSACFPSIESWLSNCR